MYGFRPQQGYIAGTVQGGAGPEAGVWVIAETTDLPTRLIKIVVTDDQGRFVLPELPMVNYHVWVRGYGLRDSARHYLRPGAHDVTLPVEPAAHRRKRRSLSGRSLVVAAAAAGARGVPAAGGAGRGLGADHGEPGAVDRHAEAGLQLLPSDRQRADAHLRSLEPGVPRAGRPARGDQPQLWERRLRTGVRGGDMYARLLMMGVERTVEVLADWTDRIAAGELPPEPRRPQGIERNAVITMWDWGTETSYMHDEIVTDKRNPTVNAGGPVYAVSSGHGKLTILDPKTHITHEVVIPTRAGSERGAGPLPAADGAVALLRDVPSLGRGAALRPAQSDARFTRAASG
jgi:hypothetical protein